MVPKFPEALWMQQNLVSSPICQVPSAGGLRHFFAAKKKWRKKENCQEYHGFIYPPRGLTDTYPNRKGKFGKSSIQICHFLGVDMLVSWKGIDNSSLRIQVCPVLGMGLRTINPTLRRRLDSEGLTISRDIKRLLRHLANKPPKHNTYKHTWETQKVYKLPRYVWNQ